MLYPEKRAIRNKLETKTFSSGKNEGMKGIGSKPTSWEMLKEPLQAKGIWKTSEIWIYTEKWRDLEMEWMEVKRKFFLVINL